MVFDLFIAMDCGDEKRLGNAARYFQEAKHTACIDHHVSNQSFAEENYIFPDASSTCELICELLDTEKITKESRNVCIPEWLPIPECFSIPARLPPR